MKGGKQERNPTNTFRAHQISEKDGTVKRIIIDLDETLTMGNENGYERARPNLHVVETLHSYKAKGYEIVIHTSRNMRTYSGQVGKINIHTLPVILRWLDRHCVPHDEVHVGKPWCGNDGFYVDDRAIRPSEFTRYSEDEIRDMLAREKNNHKD